MAKQPKGLLAQTPHHGGRAPGKEHRFREVEKEAGFEEGRYTPTIPAVIEEGFDSPEWIFQVVEGGLPVLVVSGEEGLVIKSRRGRNLARFFPEILALRPLLPCGTILDADLVCRKWAGAPHERLLLTDEEITAATLDRPCVLVAHDILSLSRRDFTIRTTGARRRALGALARNISSPVLTLADVVEQNGFELTMLACQRDFSGVRGKMKASSYPGRESRIWVEIPCDGRTRMVVGGYRLDGERLFIQCGVYENMELEFIETLEVPPGLRESLRQHMEPLTRSERSFREAPAWEPGTHWTAPDLVVELSDEGLERMRLDLCPDNIHRAHAGVWRRGQNARRGSKSGVRMQQRLRFQK